MKYVFWRSHQPYFFPYIGYFQFNSFSRCIRVFFDNVQYVRQSWMNRNRILKPCRENDQYINIKLKKPNCKSSLLECEIVPDESWKIKIIAQLEHYKRKAPYYNETKVFLEKVFEKNEHSLVAFNIRSVKKIASLLKIDTAFKLFSEMEQKVDHASEPGLWGLNTCIAFGADAYINAAGGEEFIPKSAFINAGIKLGFIQHKFTIYNQYNKEFFPGLSIIDVLMFNGVERTSEMVKDYSIKWI
ncbi:MAG: WbqC family protein [Bacteroidota bacterium]|nr:WbqC family protein [Bacteroidota bacterium]